MFDVLEGVHSRPAPFETYTASDLWTNPHTSARMLEFHLDETVDRSSRRLEFIDRSVDWITRHFDLGPGTKIIDFGCGPGLYTTRLAERKATVTGVDFSPRSIAYAKDVASEKNLNIHYANQDYLEFETADAFDLVLMIMCDFCALSPAQRGSMLEKFVGMLRPGGAVLLDVYSRAAFAQREETATYAVDLMDGFWSPSRYHGFLNVFKYEEDGVVLDKYTLIEASGTRTIYNWLQYFSPEQLERELANAGFSMEATFANVCGESFDPGGAEFAVVARKAAA